MTDFLDSLYEEQAQVYREHKEISKQKSEPMYEPVALYKWLTLWDEIYSSWLHKRRVWTVSEAACLTLGIKPDYDFDKAARLRQSQRLIHPSRIPQDYIYWFDGHIFENRTSDFELQKYLKERITLIECDIKAGVIEKIPDVLPYEVKPMNIIKWAIDNEPNMPKPLIDWYKEQNQQPESTAKQFEDLSTPEQRIEVLKRFIAEHRANGQEYNDVYFGNEFWEKLQQKAPDLFKGGQSTIKTFLASSEVKKLISIKHKSCGIKPRNKVN